MFTTCSPLFTKCSRHVHSMFTTCSWHVHVHDTFMTCSCQRHVHHMFKTYSWHVHDMFMTICSWHVHNMFKTCSQHVHNTFMTCSWQVQHLFTTCSQHVFNMFTCPFNESGNPPLPQPPPIPSYAMFLLVTTPQNSPPPTSYWPGH